MPSRSFMPYPTYEGLELTCEPAGFDPKTAPGTIDFRDIVQAGDDLPGMSLEVSMDSQYASGLIEPSEEWNSTVGAGVILYSVPSRIRRLIRLDPGTGFRWSGSLKLDSLDVFRSASLEPVLFRVRARKSGGETASHMGARLAWGPSIGILFDHFPEPGQHWLRIEWADFQEHAQLEDRKDLLFALDLDASGEMPVLRLNKGVEGLQNALNATGSGDARRIRDAVGAMIAGPVNTQLVLHLTSTLVAAAADSPEESPTDLIDNLQPWEQELARFWAERIYPEADESAVHELVRDVLDPTGSQLLEDRLSAAAQRQATVPLAFAALNEVKRWGSDR